MNLLLAFAIDEVLKEVNGEVITAAQVSLHVYCEEDEDLSLGAKLRGEVGRSN